MLHIILDIQMLGTSCKNCSEQTRQFFQEKGTVCTSGLPPILIYPGVIELLRLLYSMDDVQISYVNSDYKENDLFLRELLDKALGDEKLYNKAVQELKVYQNKTEYGIEPLKLSAIENDENTVVIADTSRLSDFSKRGNYIWGHSIKATDYDLLNPNNKSSAYMDERRYNQIYYLTSLLFNFINHRDTDELFALQYNRTENGPLFTHPLNIARAYPPIAYYDHGLSILKKVNPDLCFVNTDLYQQAISQEEKPDNPRLIYGCSDFPGLKEENYYVDKTGIIRALFNSPGKTKLIHKPRAFGGMLMTSMLKSFFSDKKSKADKLFTGTDIWDENYKNIQGQYSVISLNWNTMSSWDFDRFKSEFYYNLQNYVYELSSELDKATFASVLAKIQIPGSYQLVENPQLIMSTIIDALHQHTGKKVIVLINSYDTPLIEAYSHGYEQEAANLIQQFLQPLTANPKVEFSVLIGQQKIPPQNIFLNTDEVEVFSSLDNRMMLPYFAFTREEVKKMLIMYCGTKNVETNLDTLSSWYGYYKDEHEHMELFKPCETIRAIGNLAQKRLLQFNGSDDVLSGLSLLIQNYSVTDQQDIFNSLNSLLSGKPLVKRMEPGMGLFNLKNSAAGLLQFLILEGCLSAKPLENHEFEISIPNKATHDILEYRVKEWFADLNKEEERTSFCCIF